MFKILDMEKKKKFTTLSMEQRLNVLEDAKTSRVSDVASKYNVDETTIRRIKRNAAKILEFADKDNIQKQRRRIRKAVYEELEQRLLTWFTERKTQGAFISDALFMLKAGELRDTMESCSNFKVSSSWLAGFKKRHSIRLVRAFKESPTADKDAAKRFVEEFQKFMEEENITEENIYNMGESGLVWKALPSTTVTEDKEKCVKGYKGRKERIIIALCANALGTHKLTPLVINRYQNPRGLRDNKDELPVIFKAQNAWMTPSLFADWYENEFKPSVRAYQATNGVSKVVLLLADNEGYKMSADVQDDRFTIVYLPLSTISLIQPMDQGIIAKTKVLYRYKMLRKAATYIGDVNKFHEQYSIRDCIDILNESWIDVTPENIRDAWRKMIPAQRNVIYRCEMLRDISTITGERCGEEDVNQFVADCEASETRHFIKVEGLDMDEDVDIFDDENKDEDVDMLEDENKDGDVDVHEDESKSEDVDIAADKDEHRSTEDTGYKQEIEEVKVEGEQSESEKEELKYLFEWLGSYVAKEAPFIQQIFHIFRNHFLGS